VIGARRTDRLAELAQSIESSGGIVRYRELDVTSADDVAAFARFALDAFGSIDVLVNNAGVMPLSPLNALKVGEWNRMIDV
ncbi:SDR family NAD(P)-dependent oxidoreductase, partial [Cupriavidus sp. SIMBA_020]